MLCAPCFSKNDDFCISGYYRCLPKVMWEIFLCHIIFIVHTELNVMGSCWLNLRTIIQLSLQMCPIDFHAFMCKSLWFVYLFNPVSVADLCIVRFATSCPCGPFLAVSLHLCGPHTCTLALSLLGVTEHVLGNKHTKWVGLKGEDRMARREVRGLKLLFQGVTKRANLLPICPQKLGDNRPI